MHSGWNPGEIKYTHDIALLKMKMLPWHHQPICLGKDTEISSIKNGVVVSYGQFNETTITSDVPLKVYIPIVDLGVAIDRQWTLAQAYWNESFAAGSDKAGVCPGDSGSGYYVETNDGKNYLRGIVSSAVYEIDYNCTHNNYAFYADVLQYLDDFIFPVSII